MVVMMIVHIVGQGSHQSDSRVRLDRGASVMDDFLRARRENVLLPNLQSIKVGRQHRIQMFAPVQWFPSFQFWLTFLSLCSRAFRRNLALSSLS